MKEEVKGWWQQGSSGQVGLRKFSWASVIFALGDPTSTSPDPFVEAVSSRSNRFLRAINSWSSTLCFDCFIFSAAKIFQRAVLRQMCPINVFPSITISYAWDQHYFANLSTESVFLFMWCATRRRLGKILWDLMQEFLEMVFGQTLSLKTCSNQWKQIYCQLLFSLNFTYFTLLYLTF